MEAVIERYGGALGDKALAAKRAEGQHVASLQRSDWPG